MTSTVQFLKECASTQDLARALVQSDSDERDLCFHWVAAERQSSGRGRQGSVWRTADQSMLVSCAFRWPHRSSTSEARRELLPLLAGDVLLESVSKISGAKQNRLKQLFLKWPNDLACVNPDESIGKLGGILVEARGDVFVVGWGMNLYGAPASDVGHAVALGDYLESPVNMGDEVERLRKHFESAMNEWMNIPQTFELSLLTRLARHMSPLWGRVGRLIPSNQEAEALSLDASGGLRVRLVGQAEPREHIVSSGEFKIYYSV